MKKSSLILWCIILIGTLYHSLFLHLNEVLKIADSFAYLQMSQYISEFSQKWLGNWWFGFVYSLPIALAEIFIADWFLAAKIVNLILFSISSLLLWKISRKFLSVDYSYLVIILFYLSPTLLHFNIHVLSENIYIPLFLWVFLMTWNFIESFKNIPSPSLRIKKQRHLVITIACLIGLMYLTRAEAFIYLGSIWIIALSLVMKKSLNVSNFLKLGSIFLISFCIFISPYIFHLHSLTWEWGLTNKWASNLRQAELRGIEHMSDAGFEQAVAELTEDKTQLIAGFAGGMDYVKPQIDGSLKEFISKDPWAFVSRVLQNQKKLFTKNLPEIFLGKSPSLYYSNDTRFSHIIFLLFCIIPILVLIYGIYSLYKSEKVFLWISWAFLFPALLFFTLFFTLNRYFLIFLPLILIAFVYGVQSIKSNIMWSALIKTFLIWNIILIFLLSTSVYYNIESPKDEYYSLKQEAGKWLEHYCLRDLPKLYSCRDSKVENLKIMERFPIVTYYAGSMTRYITPYTEDIGDIYEYWIYNNIDILVVDSMDFETYRPKLIKYLQETPTNFLLLKKFENNKWQKVILYELK